MENWFAKLPLRRQALVMFAPSWLVLAGVFALLTLLRGWPLPAGAATRALVVGFVVALLIVGSVVGRVAWLRGRWLTAPVQRELAKVLDEHGPCLALLAHDGREPSLLRVFDNVADLAAFCREYGREAGRKPCRAVTVHGTAVEPKFWLRS